MNLYIVTEPEISTTKCSLTNGAEEDFTLYVNTTGHELYAFVNGELAGYQHSVNGPYIFQFQAPVTLRAGKNYISLLSATVGLKVLLFTDKEVLFPLIPAVSTMNAYQNSNLKTELRSLLRADARRYCRWAG